MLLIILIIFIMMVLLEMGETAILNLTKQKIISHHSHSFSKRLLNLKDNMDSAVIATLLCDSLLHFFLSVMIINWITKYFGESMINIMGTGITIFITLISVVAKVLALRYPHITLNLAYWPMASIIILCKPVIKIFKDFVDLLTGKQQDLQDTQLYKKELMYYLDSNKHNMEEVEMMKSMLVLQDITVNTIMTYKSMFVSAEYNENLEQMKRNILHTSSKKKIIIWQDNKDNILGTIDTKEFLVHFTQNNIVNIKYLIRPPKFFSDSTDIYKILQYFRVAKDKIVFIVNEYGILLGVVTLTDIVNEIIGETDMQEEDFYEEIDERTVVVDGMYYLRSLNKKMDWDIPEEMLTVVGLVMNITKSLPDPHTSVFCENYEFTVQSVYNNRINRVIITKHISDME